MKLAVPLPKDLCGDRKEKTVRRKVKAAQGRSSRGLVPCKDGKLRFLQFRIARRRVLVLVEEDRRPSYLSGGSHFRAFALVGRALVHDVTTLWKRLRTKKKLRDADKANLLVAALMLKGSPDMVLNAAQSKGLRSRWPQTKHALALAPPGFGKTAAGHLVLQAWTTGSYSERGVSCSYLTGWRLTFRAAQNIQAVSNHKYASGRNMGQPCGKPLPGARP